MRHFLISILFINTLCTAGASTIPTGRHINFSLIDSLSLIIEKDSSNHEAINQRGVYYYNLEKYKEALDDYLWAVRLDTKNPIYNSNRGGAYLALRDEYKASESYNRAIRFNKNSLSGYEGKFDLYLEQGELEKAKKILEEIKKIAPQDPLLYTLEGEWLWESGDLVNALVMLQKSNTLEPLTYRTSMDLAEYFLTNGYFSKADSIASAYLINEPYTCRALKTRSLAAVYQGRLSDAMSDCNLVLQYDSTNAGHWAHRGRCYMLLGKLYEARSDLKKAIEIDSTHLDALFLRARVLQQDGRLSEAIRCYSTLLSQFPRTDSLYFQRAECRHKLGDFFNASKDYEKAIALNKGSELYYNNSAANYTHMGWQRDGIKQYKIVLWMNPNALYAMCNIGTAYFYVGDLERAEKYLKEFLTKVGAETDMKFVDLARDVMTKIEKKKREGK